MRFDEDHMEHHRQRLLHKMEAVGRRGFGGWGGPGRGFGGPGRGWGDFGGFGDNVRIGRMLASGDLRLVALYFIEQQPRHGYDLIKALEEKTGGVYVPSPGVIYPALTFLEEASYVTSVTEANKRLYTITDEGRAYLGENREAVESTLVHLSRLGAHFEKMRAHWEEAHRGEAADHDMPGVPEDVNEARRDLKQAIRDMARTRNPENLRRLADILRRAAAEIRDGFGDKPRRPDDVDI